MMGNPAVRKSNPETKLKKRMDRMGIGMGESIEQFENMKNSKDGQKIKKAYVSTNKTEQTIKEDVKEGEGMQ